MYSALVCCIHLYFLWILFLLLRLINFVNIFICKFTGLLLWWSYLFLLGDRTVYSHILILNKDLSVTLLRGDTLLRRCIEDGRSINHSKISREGNLVDVIVSPLSRCRAYVVLSGSDASPNCPWKVWHLILCYVIVLASKGKVLIDYHLHVLLAIITCPLHMLHEQELLYKLILLTLHHLRCILFLNHLVQILVKSLHANLLHMVDKSFLTLLKLLPLLLDLLLLFTSFSFLIVFSSFC